LLHPWQFFRNHARSSRVFFEKQLNLLLLQVGDVATYEAQPPHGEPLRGVDGTKVLGHHDLMAQAVRYGILQSFATLDEFLFCTLEAYGGALGFDVRGPVSGMDTLDALLFNLDKQQRSAMAPVTADLRMFMILKEQFLDHTYHNGSGLLQVKGPKDPILAQLATIKGFSLSTPFEGWSGRRNGWVVPYSIDSPEPLELLIGYCLLIYGVLLDHCLAHVPEAQGKNSLN
jgi:hypothetical protein